MEAIAMSFFSNSRRASAYPFAPKKQLTMIAIPMSAVPDTGTTKMARHAICTLVDRFLAGRTDRSLESEKKLQRFDRSFGISDVRPRGTFL